MSPQPDVAQTYEVECPHCHKSFKAKPAAGRASRFSGFKCPHCRLFVPFERVFERDLLEPVDGE